MRIKRLHVISASLVLPILATGVVVFAQVHKPVQVQLSSAVKSAPTSQVAAATTPSTTLPAETVPTTATAPAAIPPAPTAADNQAQLQNLILTTAANRGLTPYQATAQWTCIDKIVSVNPGYNDYSAALNASITSVFMDPYTYPTGQSVFRLFDGAGSCRVIYPAPTD